MYSGYPQLLYFYHLFSQWCVIKSVFSVFSVSSTLALSTRVTSCYVVHSRDFHLCHFVPPCPLPRCPLSRFTRPLCNRIQTYARIT